MQRWSEVQIFTVGMLIVMVLLFVALLHDHGGRKAPSLAKATANNMLESMEAESKVSYKLVEFQGHLFVEARTTLGGVCIVHYPQCPCFKNPETYIGVNNDHKPTP